MQRVMLEEKGAYWELNGTMDEMNHTHLTVYPAHLEINPTGCT